MEIVPRRSAGSVADGGQVSLVDVQRAGEVRVGIDDGVAAGVDFALEEPGKDMVRARLHAGAGIEAELQPSAVRERGLPGTLTPALSHRMGE